MDLIKQFEFTQLLKSDPQAKVLVVLGKIADKDAIISIEKSHFITEEDKFNPADLVLDLSQINHNDIYFWFHALLDQTLENNPAAKLNLIYPATETHIQKYGKQELHYVKETAETYIKFVKPYIETMKGDRIKWVYNILFEGKESETFIHHDKNPETGYVLLPDMKWDKLNLDSLYLCCIIKRKDISSIRDLNGTHVRFLKDLKCDIKKVTSEKFQVHEDSLRLFVHYQPSYYHFHIHVVNVKHAGLGDGISAGKAILLDDVIENLEVMDTYYEKRTLFYVIGENHGIWKNEGFRRAQLN